MARQYVALILALVALLGVSNAQDEVTIKCLTCGEPSWFPVPDAEKPEPCSSDNVGEERDYVHDGGFCAEVIQPAILGEDTENVNETVVFRGYLSNTTLAGVGIGNKQCGRFVAMQDWDTNFNALGIFDLCTCDTDSCNGDTSGFEEMKTRCYACVAMSAKSDDGLASGPASNDPVEYADCAVDGKKVMYTRPADASCLKLTVAGKLFMRSLTLRGEHEHHDTCIKAEEGTEIGGVTIDPGNLDVKVCYCNGDLCNGASGVVGSSVLALAIVAALVRALTAGQIC